LSHTITLPEVDHSKICKQAENVTLPAPLSAKRRDDLYNKARCLLQAQNVALVAHYYTDADLQQLADETGGIVSDSLDMARFGHEHPGSTLVVAGVRFMGETAKILSPDKRILMPTLEAECSLDLSCPAEEFTQFCDNHPDRTVVVYANTSAAVKARADWVVTSSIATEVVTYLTAMGETLIWAPDKYLGDYVQSVTGADMLIWQGSCVVHEKFKAKELAIMMRKHPDAAVLVHPESPPEIIAMADEVGSTTALIEATKRLTNRKFIVATDNGIFYKMQQVSPGKTFIEAPNAGFGATCRSCAHCPWMAMNGLQNLVETLETGQNEVLLDPKIGQRAMVSVQRMLDFAAQRKTPVLGYGNA